MLPNFGNLKLSTDSVNDRGAHDVTHTNGPYPLQSAIQKPKKDSRVLSVLPATEEDTEDDTEEYMEVLEPVDQIVPLLKLTGDSGFKPSAVPVELLNSNGEVLKESGDRNVSIEITERPNAFPLRTVRYPTGDTLVRGVEITLNEILELDFERLNNSCNMLRVDNKGFGFHFKGNTDDDASFVARHRDSTVDWDGHSNTTRSSEHWLGFEDVRAGGSEGLVLQMAQWQKEEKFFDSKILFREDPIDHANDVYRNVHKYVLIHMSTVYAKRERSVWAQDLPVGLKPKILTVDISSYTTTRGTVLDEAIDTFMACLYDTNGIVRPAASSGQILMQVVAWLDYLDIHADIRFVTPLLGNIKQTIWVQEALSTFTHREIIDTPSLELINSAKLRIDVITIMKFVGGIISDMGALKVTPVHIGSIFGDEFTLSLCLGETARLRIVLMLESYKLIESYIGLIDFRLVTFSGVMHTQPNVQALLVTRMKLAVHENAGGAIAPLEIDQLETRSARARMADKTRRMISKETRLSTGLFVNNAVVVPMNVNVFTWKRNGRPVVLNSWTSPERENLDATKTENKHKYEGPNYAIVKYPPAYYNIGNSWSLTTANGIPRNIQSCLLAPKGNSTWSRPPWKKNVDYDIASTYTKMCEHELPVWVYAALAAKLEGTEIPKYPLSRRHGTGTQKGVGQSVLNLPNLHNYTYTPFTFETSSMLRLLDHPHDIPIGNEELPERSIYNNQKGWEQLTLPGDDYGQDGIPTGAFKHFVYNNHLDPNMRVVGGVDLVGHVVEFDDSPLNMQLRARYKLITPNEYART